MFTTTQAYSKAVDDGAGQILVEALREYAQKSADLAAATAEVRTVCDRLDHALEGDFNVNSLGELQSRGLRLDVLCAERSVAAQSVVKVASQLKRLGVLTEDQTAEILSGTPFERKSEV